MGLRKVPATAGTVARHSWVKLKTRRIYLGVRLALPIAAATPPLLWSAPASAQTVGAEATERYALPSGPLGQTLANFAARAGVSISYEPTLVDGKVSQGLSGHYSVLDGLDKLLAGTGLAAESHGDKRYVIQKAPKGPDPAPPPATPTTHNDSVLTLPSVTVSGVADAASTNGFVSPQTSTATRTDTAIADTPQSITVVNQAVIQSQQSRSLTDVLENVSGVYISPSLLGPTVEIRGLSAPVMTDGLNSVASSSFFGTQQQSSSLSMPVAAVQQVEVLKGADAIIAGPSNPGGVVNLVMKAPQPEPFHEVSLQLGPYGDILSSVDLTGAMFGDDRISYRLVVSGERSGQSEGGYDGMHDVYIAPSVRWKSGGTDLKVGLIQNSSRNPFPPFTILLPTGPVNDPVRFGSAEDNYSDNDTAVYYDLTQKINDHLTFRSKARYDSELSESTGMQFVGPTDVGAGLQAFYIPTRQSTQSNRWSFDNSLQGTFNIGPVSQTVLGGFSYQKMTGSLSVANGLPVFTSIYAPQFPAFSPVIDFGYGVSANVNNEYLQDQITFGRLHVLVNVSYSRAWGWAQIEPDQPSQHGWSPNIGAVYQLTDSVGIYGNLMKTFTPQIDQTADGGFTPPQRGRSAEAGLKIDLADDRLTSTISLYRSALLDRATPDPSNPNAFVVLPQTVTRGVELDVQGSPYKGVNVIGSYTYADFLSPPAAGFSEVPKHTASLWATYDFQNEMLHGWGFGAGVKIRSAYQITTSENTSYSIAGQAEVDASVYYRAKKWTARLGVKNLFDRRLYSDYSSEDDLTIEPGRTVLFTGTYDF